MSYVPTDATPLLGFDQLIDGGSMSYNGSGGALIGQDIRFDSLRADDTPLNSGTYSIENGVLNFETGANISEGPASWEFATGGFFTLTGTVIDTSSQTIASGTLLQGSFTGPSNPMVFGSSTLIVSAFGTDTKNQDLLNYFGLVGPLFTDLFEFANTQIGGSGVIIGDTGAFRVDVQEADLVNSPVVSVPDCSIMFLLGPSLIGLGIISRRKSRK